MYEEVLSKKKKTITTHHSKILIAKTAPIECLGILHKIEELKNYEGLDEMYLVKKIKEIVPEYVSENSVFKSLDS